MRIPRYTEMVKISPRALRPGDVLVTDFYENGDPKEAMEVTETQHYACSKRGTHVNNDSCYDWSVPVEVIA